MNKRYICLMMAMIILFVCNTFEPFAAEITLQCDYNRMYTYEDMEKDIQVLKRTYPDWVSADTAGETVDGRSLYHVIVGDKNAEKNIFVFASIHAREYMTTQLVMMQLKDFLQKVASDTGLYRGISYRSLLEGVAIHIVPMANPDGVSISQIGLDGVKKSSIRQEIYKIYELDQAVELAPYLKRWKSNAEGVDVNRNFDAKWESYDDHLGHPSADHYKGTRIASTREAQGLIALTEKYSFCRTISYHVQGEVIYWYFAQEGQFLQESKAFAEEISRVTGYALDENYKNLDPAGYKDWAILKKGIPSLTIEVGKGAVPLEQGQLSKIWKQNQDVWAATLYTLKN